ncbi:MAG TPA: HlyD family secretion protein [Verrucomicrobiae bacterium]|nr:HlyD family secretion protein [Verrucomicrobiae bacterium]
MDEGNTKTAEEKSLPKKNGNGSRIAKLNSPLFIWPAAIVLAGILFFVIRIFVGALTHESTDDAFITGHIVSIAPRISGKVQGVYVTDNQFVRSNELMVVIDPADFDVTLAQKKAAQEAQHANYQAAVAEYNLMAVKVKTADADAKSSRADAEAVAATAEKARADFERAKSLQTNGTISPQEFDQAKAAMDLAVANQKSAEQKAAADESKVAEAQAQMEAAKAEAGSVLGQVHQAETTVSEAELNLSYTKIYAPCDGLVTRKQIETGNYIQTGQTLFSIVQTNVWVIANFKETQLKNITPGQSASVDIDALGKSFRAHVDSVQAGSGAAFSLLPPENATGNYVKVVQRVPVKIYFDEPLPPGKTIGPGLSVVPSVLTSSFEIPEWLVAIAAIAIAFTAAIIFKRFLRKKFGGA